MSKKIACLRCSRKNVVIKVEEETGYIEVVKGNAIVNRMSDGCLTVDFYCEKCKE
jgi:hypothetical protein